MEYSNQTQEKFTYVYIFLPLLKIIPPKFLILQQLNSP